MPPPRASTPSASGGAAVPGAAGASADGALQARLRRLRALGCHECLQPLLVGVTCTLYDCIYALCMVTLCAGAGYSVRVCSTCVVCPVCVSHCRPTQTQTCAMLQGKPWSSSAQRLVAF